MMFDNFEDAFKELDKRAVEERQLPYKQFAQQLSAFQKALLEEGFTRRESLRFVEQYSKVIYDLSYERAVILREAIEDANNDDPEEPIP